MKDAKVLTPESSTVPIQQQSVTRDGNTIFCQEGIRLPCEQVQLSVLHIRVGGGWGTEMALGALQRCSCFPDFSHNILSNEFKSFSCPNPRRSNHTAVSLLLCKWINQPTLQPELIYIRIKRALGFFRTQPPGQGLG